MPQSQIRWLIRRDMDEVLAIENASISEPWQEEDFHLCLRKRRVIGTVAEVDFDTIAGFMVYELHKTILRVLKFAVDPNERRKGIGTQMVERLIDKLKPTARTEIEIAIPEQYLPAQLLFSKHGFKCEEVRGEQYVFRYWVGNRSMAQQTTEPESAQ